MLVGKRFEDLNRLQNKKPKLESFQESPQKVQCFEDIDVTQNSMTSVVPYTSLVNPTQGQQRLLQERLCKESISNHMDETRKSEIPGDGFAFLDHVNQNANQQESFQESKNEIKCSKLVDDLRNSEIIADTFVSKDQVNTSINEQQPFQESLDKLSIPTQMDVKENSGSIDDVFSFLEQVSPSTIQIQNQKTPINETNEDLQRLTRDLDRVYQTLNPISQLLATDNRQTQDRVDSLFGIYKYGMNILEKITLLQDSIKKHFNEVNGIGKEFLNNSYEYASLPFESIVHSSNKEKKFEVYVKMIHLFNTYTQNLGMFVKFQRMQEGNTIILKNLEDEIVVFEEEYSSVEKLC